MLFQSKYDRARKWQIDEKNKRDTMNPHDLKNDVEIADLLEKGDLYAMVLLVYIILTWIPANPGSVLGDVKAFLAKISEPYLRLFQKLIPPIGVMVDVTPIIALLVLQFGIRFIVSIF